jgi:hypothetical protein
MMPRIRTIKPEFWTNEQLALLSLHARLLAIALLNFSDDEGYFLGNASLVRASCFPFEDCSKNVLGSLQELSRVGYIEVRECSGKTVGKVVKFRDHQRIDKPQTSRLAALFQSVEPEKTQGNNSENQDSKNIPGTFQEPSGKTIRLEQGKEQGKGTGNREREDASKEFETAWTRWKMHSLDKGKSINGISEETQLMQLAQAYPDVADRIAAIEYAILKNWANVNLGGDHNRPPPETRSHGRKQKTTFEEVGL